MDLKSDHPAIRYWAAIAKGTTFAIKKAKLALNRALIDESVVLDTSSKSLAHQGSFTQVDATYLQALSHNNMSAVQYAARSIEIWKNRRKVF